MKRFLIAISTAALATVAVTTSACVAEVADPDPGVCWTSGKYDNRWVEDNTSMSADAYVQMVCQDWVWMLLQNCVEVYDLPFMPTDVQVALYCRDNIRHDNGHQDYQIDHSCNFVDNPNFECALYGSNASQPGAEEFPISEASEEAIAGFNDAAKAKPELESSIDRTSITVLKNGVLVEVPASELFKR